MSMNENRESFIVLVCFVWNCLLFVVRFDFVDCEIVSALLLLREEGSFGSLVNTICVKGAVFAHDSPLLSTLQNVTILW